MSRQNEAKALVGQTFKVKKEIRIGRYKMKRGDLLRVDDYGAGMVDAIAIFINSRLPGHKFQAALWVFLQHTTPHESKNPLNAEPPACEWFLPGVARPDVANDFQPLEYAREHGYIIPVAPENDDAADSWPRAKVAYAKPKDAQTGKGRVLFFDSKNRPFTYPVTGIKRDFY